MRFADLVRLALGALTQQKLRTTLGVAGVIISSCLLATSLAVGEGVRAAVERRFSFEERLRRVEVYPSYSAEEADIPAEALRIEGEVSDEKRERLRQAIVLRWPREHNRPRVVIDQPRLSQIEALPHVQRVVPSIYERGLVKRGDKTESAVAVGSVADDAQLAERMVAGQVFSDNDEAGVLVNEYLLYKLGIVTDEQIDELLGQKLRLEFHPSGQALASLVRSTTGGRVEFSPEETAQLDAALQVLPALIDALDLPDEQREVLKKAFSRPRDEVSAPDSPRQNEVIAAELTVRGVFRDLRKDEKRRHYDFNLVGRDVDLVLPIGQAQGLYFQAIDAATAGVNSVSVLVDESAHVAEVGAAIEEMGLEQFSLVEFAERVRMNLAMVTIALSVLAGVALVVSALGITNTMVMSVLERTREIGVMKAVGARDGHIEAMFLMEGALLGLVGGAAGVFAAWLISFPGNHIARVLLEQEFNKPFDDPLFLFPFWLVAGIPAVALLITTAATLYPARRAAKIDPIRALRHE